MKRKTIDIEEARKVMDRLRTSDPVFEGSDLALATKWHRRFRDASIGSAAIACTILLDFPEHWARTSLFFLMFGMISFYARQQAAKIDDVREHLDQGTCPEPR